MNMEATPEVSTAKSARKWRSGKWRAVAGGMTMIAALAVVWAVLSSFTVWQRERDLEQVTQELNDLREEIERREETDANRDDRALNDLIDQYEAMPESIPAPEEVAEDPLDLLEAEVNAVTDEE